MSGPLYGAHPNLEEDVLFDTWAVGCAAFPHSLRCPCLCVSVLPPDPLLLTPLAVLAEPTLILQHLKGLSYCQPLGNHRKYSTFQQRPKPEVGGMKASEGVSNRQARADTVGSS